MLFESFVRAGLAASSACCSPVPAFIISSAAGGVTAAALAAALRPLLRQAWSLDSLLSVLGAEYAADFAVAAPAVEVGAAGEGRFLAAELFGDEPVETSAEGSSDGDVTLLCTVADALARGAFRRALFGFFLAQDPSF